jgi:hypothetical protein
MESHGDIQARRTVLESVLVRSEHDGALHLAEGLHLPALILISRWQRLPLKHDTVPPRLTLNVAQPLATSTQQPAFMRAVMAAPAIRPRASQTKPFFRAITMAGTM